MNLGETIRQLRNEQGLTQPELAARAQIEQSYLSKLENDKGTPSFDIINRIALALGLNGMELIRQLPHAYIEERLGHLPEVAAEYASVKARLLARQKQRFIVAAVLTTLGIGTVIAGRSALLFPEYSYEYQSLGVVREDENVWRFREGLIPGSAETTEDYLQRLQENTSRLVPEFRLTHAYRGQEYIDVVEGGRRLFVLVNDHRDLRRENSLLTVLGSMLTLAGGFLLYFVHRFRPDA